MRVCHIWHNFFPFEFGGAEQYILSLSDFLSQQNQNMRFLLLTDKSNVPFSRARQIPNCQRINSLEVHRLGPTLTSYLGNAFYRLWHRNSELLDYFLTLNLYKTATNIPEIKKVEIFHVHGFWHPLYPTIGLMLSEHFQKPLVVSLHGDSVDCSDPISMQIETPIALNVLRHADVIITYSRKILDVLQELGFDKKSRLIQNFVNTTSFNRPPLRSNGSGNRAIMVSRLDQAKDPMTSIRAFAEVRKELPQATLKIIGYGPLYEDIEKLIQDLNLKDAVTLVGPKTDVREFLWNSDIFIATRASDIATLEAWAAKLAVIAPKFGIMEEIITDGRNGLLVPPGDVEQIACTLIKTMKNRNLQKNLAENGVLSVKEHDIRAVAARIADIYNSLLLK